MIQAIPFTMVHFAIQHATSLRPSTTMIDKQSMAFLKGVVQLKSKFVKTFVYLKRWSPVNAMATHGDWHHLIMRDGANLYNGIGGIKYTLHLKSENVWQTFDFEMSYYSLNCHINMDMSYWLCGLLASCLPYTSSPLYIPQACLLEDNIQSRSLRAQTLLFSVNTW